MNRISFFLWLLDLVELFLSPPLQSLSPRIRYRDALSQRNAKFLRRSYRHEFAINRNDRDTAIAAFFRNLGIDPGAGNFDEHLNNFATSASPSPSIFVGRLRNRSPPISNTRPKP
jgi:hypothetical protein